MPFGGYETIDKTLERRQRMQARVPDLRYGTPDDVLKVDAVRDGRRELPSELSRTATRAGAVAARRKQEEEAARRFREVDRASVDRPYTVRTSTTPFSDPSSPLYVGTQEVEYRGPQERGAIDRAVETAFGIGYEFDRPRGGLFGGIEGATGGNEFRAALGLIAPQTLNWRQAIREGVEGFKQPEAYQGRDMVGVKRLPDQDVLPFGLSIRDVAGGGADIALDPTNFIPAAVVADAARGGRLTKSAFDIAGEGVVREAVGNAAERVGLGTLRPARGGSPGAVQRATDVPPGRARVVGASLDTPAVVEPTEMAANLIDLRPIEAGLSRRDRALNAIKGVLGTGVDADDIATPAFRERSRVMHRVASQANRLGAESESIVRQAFPDIENTRIPSLAGIVEDIPGAPTVADIAARFPEFEPVLTPAQKTALERLRSEVEPYRQLLEELGVEVRSRPDVMEGGFYLPRGGAEVLGEEAARPKGGGRRVGGRKGFERTTRFPSQAAGIEAGFEYDDVGEALRSYAQSAGERALDQHLVNYFLAARDEAGNALARSAADEINPALRAQVETLRSKIGSRLETLRGQNVRLGAQEAEAGRAGSVAGRAVDLAENARQRAQAIRSRRTATEIVDDADDMIAARTVVDDTDGVLKAADRELSILERQARQAEARSGQSSARARAQALRRRQTLEDLTRLRDELDSLKGAWDTAKRQAAETPRGRGRIQVSGLQGYTFPDVMADAANAEIAKLGPATGRGSQVVKTIAGVNQLLRGLRATGDLSFMGIQSLLAAASEPRAYGRSTAAAIRSLFKGGDQELGDYLRMFDANAAENGLPTASDWAASGLRIGGADTEFKLGQGLAGMSQRVQRAPVVRQANRAFGYAGDVLRSEWAQAEYMRRVAAGETPDMEAIARAVNRATGWTESRFAGELGELGQFAPRFFQSQLETLAAAATKRGAEGQIPRKAILRLVGLGVLATVAANEARGEETSFDPTDSNFMRIRNLGGDDLSLFGPWDSLARAVVKLGQGDAGYLLRTKASPAVQLAWDHLTGETFMGENPRDPDELLKNLVPFSVQELPENSRALAEGDPSALAAIAIESAGVKSSPLTLRERVNEGEYEQLSPDEQFRAIPAQTWRTVVANVPDEIKDEMSKFDSVYDWRNAVIDSWTKAYEADGHSPGESRREAERQFERLPTYRYYLDVKNWVETNWYRAHPREGQRYFEEQMRLPAAERRNMPTQAQMRVIEQALAGVSR